MPEPVAKEKGKYCCCFSRPKSVVSDSTVFEVASKTSQYSAQLSFDKLPFTCALPPDLKTGTAIIVKGRILYNCSRFAIDLLPDNKKNIGFHLNPRLNQRYIVRNWKLNDQWGQEETTSIQKFPFQRNKEFVLNIFIAEGEFLVSLNGKHICGFIFRVPLSKLTTIEIHGSVDVYGVDFRELQIYPELGPENAPITVAMGDDDNAITTGEKLEIPATALLPEGFQQGWQLEIYGRVKILPHSFCINLQEGAQLWPHPVINLHLNPRFNTSSGEFLLVRNTWINGGWGPEERTREFRFVPGSSFTLSIRKGTESFGVWVDRQFVSDYKFRGDVDNINTVYIQGDVAVDRIVMRKNVSQTYLLNNS